ncbi:MAG: hypothetical protein JWO49_2904 [Arthrobacter sp.]|jgi:hypothetical protein|nr:hypothetical protein [Arthrobacter sp.]
MTLDVSPGHLGEQESSGSWNAPMRMALPSQDALELNRRP